jgi:hypothetical protein
MISKLPYQKIVSEIGVTEHTVIIIIIISS